MLFGKIDKVFYNYWVFISVSSINLDFSKDLYFNCIVILVVD